MRFMTQTVALAAAALFLGAVSSIQAAPSAPRIPVAYGALAGPGTITFASVRYCDDSARPASFRVTFRVFDDEGRAIGRRTTTKSSRSRCDQRLGVPVRTGTTIGASLVVRVTNLATGRSALKRVNDFVST